MSTKTVGNYTLVEKLGQGSYATVYKAHHKTNGGNFAVKVISREKIGSTKLQANLEQEISIMKEITHENVVRLFGTFTSKNNIYLVLEFCGGGDLQLFIRKHKRLDETVARRFLIQLARGLHFLHSKNIIHRDIKPQNLLLSEFSPNAVIKFADFGFAKHLQEASMAQTPCGTPLYMAPEIFEMKEYDAKADVWSVGCVLFEMCTGEPPFKGSNHRELFMNIRSKSLRLPSSVTLSPEVTEILQRLLEINPQRRVSLDMLYRVTERLAAHEQLLDTPSSGTSGDDSGGSSSISKSGDRSGLQDQQHQHDQSGEQSSNSNKDPDITGTVSGSALSSSRSRPRTSSTSAGGDNVNNNPSSGHKVNMSSSHGSGGSSGSGGSGSGGGASRRRSSGDLSSSPAGSPLPGESQGLGTQSSRRLRGRDKVAGDGGGNHTSTTAGLNTGSSNNSASGSSMTPATATMLVKLANPGTSPNAGERSLSEHATTSSSGGGSRGSSAVSRALSSAFSDPATDQHDTQDDRRRSPGAGHSPVPQQYPPQNSKYNPSPHSRDSPQQLEGSRHRTSPSMVTGSKKTPPPASTSTNANTNPTFGRDSDDFVMIDEPSSTAYNSTSNTSYNNATWRTSEQGQISNLPQQHQQQQQGEGSPSSAHWYGGSPGSNIAGNIYIDSGAGGGLLETASASQQQSSSEVLQLSQCAHRCQYISSIVAAMTKHADSVVKAVLAKYGKTISKELDREAILGGAAGRGGDKDRDSNSREGSREVSPRQRSSTSSSGGDSYNVFSSSNQQLDSNLQLLSEALCVPFSFYLHSMNYIQDAIQRTVSLKMQQQQQAQQRADSPSPSSPSSYFFAQLDGLVSGLTQRFDQLMSRAEGCQRWIRSDASPPPVPEPLIYEAALKLGQEAAVEELLGNLKHACDHYWDAKLLVECVLLSATEASDRRVLQGYAKMFLDQFVVCEKSNALLEYDRSGVARSYDHKSVHSPGSNSSFDSHMSLNSNTPSQNPNQNVSGSPLLHH